MGNQSIKTNKKHNIKKGEQKQTDSKQPTYDLQQTCFSISPRKKKQKKTQQVWKTNFFFNCQDLGGEQYPWIQHIQKLVKNQLTSTRSNYLVEVQQLQLHLEGHLKAGSGNQNLDDDNLFNALQGSILIPEQVLKKSVLASNTKFNSMKKTLTRSYLGAVNTTTSNSSIRNHHKNNVISFIDQSMQSLFKNKQAQLDKKIKQDIKLFIRLTQMIENHIKDKKNTLSSINYTYSKSTHQVIINQLLAFIDLYKITMIDFYKLEKFCQVFNNEQILDDENLNNFVMSILFKDQRVYETVFSVFKKKNQVKQADFDGSLEEINKIVPSDFSISDEYCLNQKTLDWYMMKMSFEPCIQNVEIKQTEEFCPYDNCIKKLKQLDVSKTPMAKLKVMLSCADKVSACMKQFYQSNSLEVKKSIVDADQILSIFQYILVNSKISNLYTHLDIIENFSNQSQMKSMAGYYYSVILSALQHISNQFKMRKKVSQKEDSLINQQKPQQS